MLPWCLHRLSRLCFLCFLAQCINAAVVTLDGEVISIDSAHNVFVNGVEVLAGSPTPTSSLSSRFLTSATATSSEYLASETGDSVTDSTRVYNFGTFNDDRSECFLAATGEHTHFTRTSSQVDSSSSLIGFNVRSTASKTGNSVVMVEASLTHSTVKYASSATEPVTTTSMNQYSKTAQVSVSSGSSLMSTPKESEVPDSSFSITVSLHSLVSRTAGSTKDDSPPIPKTSATETASHTSAETMPDTTFNSGTAILISPSEPASGSVISSTVAGDDNQPTGSSNGPGGVGGGILPGDLNAGGFGGPAPKQVGDSSNPEDSKSNVNSMEKPSTSAETQSQLVSSPPISTRSFTTRFTSETRSALTSNSTISPSSASNSTLSVASVSATCTSCSSCLNIHFNPTVTPDPLDDDENDETRRRRSIDRLEKRIAAVKASRIARNCTVATFYKKPSYPGPANVANNERKTAREMSAFFATATFWAVPTSATCNGVPGWTYMDTPHIGALTPAYQLGGNILPFVSIDHVYEISLLEQFFIDQVAGGFTCSDITALFDVSDSGTKGTRLNTIFGYVSFRS